MLKNRLSLSALFLLFTPVIFSQVLHYDFEGNLNDETSNAFNGSSSNSTYVSNENGDGQAKVFDGTQATVVSFPNDAQLKPTSFPITVAVTARITDVSGSPAHCLFSSDMTQNTYMGVSLIVTSTGAVSLSIGNGTTTNPFGRRSFGTQAGIIQENQWYKIVVVVRGPNVGDMDLWINCTKYTSATDYACGTIVDQNNPCYSGCATVNGMMYTAGSNGAIGFADVNAVSPYFMIGEMDELRYYTSELTESEILDLNGTGVSASLSGGDVVASPTVASLQWVNCGTNYAAIANETGQLYSPASTGDYAVVASLNGCTDTSNCVFVDLTGISELSKLNGVIVSPNPTEGKSTIDLGRKYKETSVQITDLQGRIILTQTVKNQQLIDLDIMGNAGLYLIHIVSDDALNGIIPIVKN